MLKKGALKKGIPPSQGDARPKLKAVPSADASKAEVDVLKAKIAEKITSSSSSTNKAAKILSEWMKKSPSKKS